MKFSETFSFRSNSAGIDLITGCTETLVLDTAVQGLRSLINASNGLGGNYLDFFTTLNSDNQVKRTGQEQMPPWPHSSQLLKQSMHPCTRDRIHGSNRTGSNDQRIQSSLTIRDKTKNYLNNELHSKRKQKFTFQHERLRALESISRR